MPGYALSKMMETNIVASAEIDMAAEPGFASLIMKVAHDRRMA